MFGDRVMECLPGGGYFPKSSNFTSLIATVLTQDVPLKFRPFVHCKFFTEGRKESKVECDYACYRTNFFASCDVLQKSSERTAYVSLGR